MAATIFGPLVYFVEPFAPRQKEALGLDVAPKTVVAGSQR